MTLFSDVPSVVLPTVIVLISCTLSLLPYMLARKFLLTGSDEHSKDLAGQECHLLLVEPRGVVNTGEAGGDKTAGNDVWA